MNNHQAIAHIIVYELMPRLKKHRKDITESPATPEVISLLGVLKANDRISTHEVRQVLDELFAEPMVARD